MIKKISCFGTSCTAGGGFEFESKTNVTWSTKDDYILGDKLKSIYKGFTEPLDQDSFSYPGHLKRIVQEYGVQVNHYSKSGYGNEKVYREVFNVIQQPDFDSKTHLLLIEITGLGRKEIFCKEINDFFIVNYRIEDDEIPKGPFGMKHTWWYPNEKTDVIDKNESTITDFLDFHLEVNNQLDVLVRNLSLFFGWLEFKGINYRITNWLEQREVEESTLFPKDINDIVDRNSISWNVFGKQYNTWIQMINDNSLRIWDETKGEIEDNHFGYYGNKLISSVIYNQVISDINNTPKLSIEKKDYRGKYACRQ